MAFAAFRGHAAQEDRVLLVNETADTRYDRALRGSIRYFQGRTKIQLGVILKERLPAGKTIEEFATAAFAREKLGRGYGGRALLFVWSEKERLFKIEVGYELEGVFPDATCKRLEEGARTFMLSTTGFARRDFLTELIVTMGLHYLDFRKTGKLSELTLSTTGPGSLSTYQSGGGGIVGRGYAASVERVQQELVPLPAALAKDLQPDASVEEVVRRYMVALELGIGAPQIPLLTEGSVYFRMEKPHAPGYLQRIRRYQESSSPYRIVRQADLAAVVFQPKSPVLPILLRRDDKGLWFVDEPAAWAAFHLYEDGSSQLKYANSAFAFARTGGNHGEGRPALYEGMASAPAPIPLAFDLKERIRQAEGDIYRNPGDSATYLRLAELLHFEVYWIEAAAPLYDKVLAMDPRRSELRWRLIDIYRNSADADGQERQFIALLKADPNDGNARWYYDWFKKFYN